jgi:1-acyl-sn-glycerol-3-phosphate acyltransferase
MRFNTNMNNSSHTQLQTTLSARNNPGVKVPAAPDRAAVAARLMVIVRELAREMQSREGKQVDVQLDSNLDLDLGLDSLGRFELLQRLDRAFCVRLSEQVISDAATPGDLLEGVLVAKPDMSSSVYMPDIARTDLPGVTEPTDAKTLLDAFGYHARTHPGRPHIHLWISDSEERTITYGHLDQASRKAAAGLLDLGLEPGDRAAIMLPTSIDFFVAFFAVLIAGGVPVPVYPPFRRAQIEDHMRRQAGILRTAQARFLITDAEIRPLAGLLKGLAEDLNTVATVAELSRAPATDHICPASSQTIALIQFTSGSTGDPKGVVLTHANLLANIRAMGEAMQVSSKDVFVSWLPLYHDMGLIGAWLGSLYFGVPLAIMSPLAFLANPARWLRSIHHHRGTLGAAPNFAFELCLKNVRDEDIKDLDLSTMRMVVNGAEPVSPSTIRRFAERFAAYGFRPETMAPVYGLAECSVGLAFPPVNRSPIIDRVQRAPLAGDGLAIPAKHDEAQVVEFVACGRPLPRHQIRIVDDRGAELPDRQQGRLEFKGPSATSGYFRNDEKTQALFDGEWLDSGDLAYIVNGDIYLTGRIKDMIIRAGRNIYPHELEEVLGNIDDVRKGCVAVFACADQRTGTERLIVMAETRLSDADDIERLKEQIVQSSIKILEMPPDEIVLVPPRTVPKTSSGKVRRTAARQLYESQAIDAGQRALWLQLVRLGIEGLQTRARRVIRRAAELGYAGYWWSLLVGVSVVVWPLVIVLPKRSWRHAVLSSAARSFLALTGTTLTVEGAASLPAGGAMIVANHTSYLDGLILSAALTGQFSFIAKYELQRQWVANLFLSRLGAVFVRRIDVKGGLEDTNKILTAAREGARIVAFPEGTFSRMPGVLPFRLGAFSVAVEAQIPIVPVAIKGPRMILRGGQWLPRPGGIAVNIGEPLRPDGVDFAAAVRLRDRCRTTILQQVGEPDLASERIELAAD